MILTARQCTTNKLKDLTFIMIFKYDLPTDSYGPSLSRIIRPGPGPNLIERESARDRFLEHEIAAHGSGFGLGPSD